MKDCNQPEYEFRVVAAGMFKATCLQLLDEVHENKNLVIIVTKRGKPIGHLIGAPDGLKLTGPTVQRDTYPTSNVTALQADAAPADESPRKKKKDKKKKHK